MNAWSKLNIALAAVAALLFAALMLSADNTAEDPLTTIPREDITSVRVERGDSLALHLERDDRGWRIEYPEQTRAELQRVEQLLAVTRAAVLQRYAAPDDLQRYGLQVPKAVLQINDQRLLFGDRDPSQSRRYVLVDNQLCVIDDVYYNLLTLPPTHFIQR